MIFPSVSQEQHVPPTEGEWFAPHPEKYSLECCDCGKRHRVDFRSGRYDAGGNFIESKSDIVEIAVWDDIFGTHEAREARKPSAKARQKAPAKVEKAKPRKTSRPLRPLSAERRALCWASEPEKNKGDDHR